MLQKIPFIIQSKAFILLAKIQKIVLIDVRTGPNAAEKYAASHLEGALHVDMDHQLADVKSDAAQGGRHPLPGLPQFAAVLTQLGITRDSHVVVYDDKNGANPAARFWWMLQSVGHPAVQVLNGGMDAALQAGFASSSKTEAPEDVPVYEVDHWILPLADLQEVKKATHDGSALIIDVRDAARYRGETEPIDLIAGHIPTAINIPFTENMDTDGLFLSPNTLREKYEQALGDRTAEQVVVHCGSGVTACHTLLAMDYAGMELPKLYVGSWSEWSRRDLPIATGEI